jgi:hypothetical protein
MNSQTSQKCRISLTPEARALLDGLGHNQRTMVRELITQLESEYQRGFPYGGSDLPGLPPLQIWARWGIRLLYRVINGQIKVLSIEFDPTPPKGGGNRISLSWLVRSYDNAIHWIYPRIVLKKDMREPGRVKPITVKVEEMATILLDNAKAETGRAISVSPVGSGNCVSGVPACDVAYGLGSLT